jgi:sensor histidine kinase YesM
VSAAWVAVLEITLNPWATTPWPPPFASYWIQKFYHALLADLILYGGVLLVGHVLDSRERLAHQQTETARLNEQLSTAKLNALRRQIEPHFLFNALNAIAGLVRERKNDAAVSMIVALSDFLRGVVEDSDRQQVPLAEELEFVQKYLDIQNVQGGAIRISAARANGIITLRVYNDGPSLPQGWEKTQSGIGISNVRTRLQTLYGNAFTLNMENEKPDGVSVSVSLPFVSLLGKE